MRLLKALLDPVLLLQVVDEHVLCPNVLAVDFLVVVGGIVGDGLVKVKVGSRSGESWFDEIGDCEVSDGDDDDVLQDH